MSDDQHSGDETRPAWYSRLRHLIKGDTADRSDLAELLADPRWKAILDSDELAMLQGVLDVSETQVRDVMIPRSHMVVLERDAPQREILQMIIDCGHSRFPVIGDDRDEVVGILLAKDVLRHFVESPEQPFRLADFLRPATLIPESKRLNTLLKEFRGGRNHMAIVVDEYGGTAGLLTIEDVLEEIVGDIDDEHDPEVAERIHMVDASHYHVRALTRIDEFNEYFETSLSDENYDTIGGLVMHELGRLPRRGESVALEGFRFRVIQADRRRIHAVDVTRETPASAE